MSEIQPKRPAITKAMILAAAEVVAAKIDADAETIAEHYAPGMDGFELAIELAKSAYWDVSRDDMEALDEVDWLVDAALREAEKEWAATNNHPAPFLIGDRVRCDVRRETGTITGVSERLARTYEVKPDGQDDTATGSRRWLCKFEQVSAA